MNRKSRKWQIESNGEIYLAVWTQHGNIHCKPILQQLIPNQLIIFYGSFVMVSMVRALQLLHNCSHVCWWKPDENPPPFHLSIWNSDVIVILHGFELLYVWSLSFILVLWLCGLKIPALNINTREHFSLTSIHAKVFSYKRNSPKLLPQFFAVF